MNYANILPIILVTPYQIYKNSNGIFFGIGIRKHLSHKPLLYAIQYTQKLNI